jgi:hypothetical protein
MEMVLRVFLTRHVLKQKHYALTQEQHDFPPDILPEAAYAELLTKHGSVLKAKAEVEILQGLKIKVAPDQFITINSHSLVDVDRPKMEVGPVERHTEQALPFDFKACLQDSPNLSAKRKRRHRSVSE